MPVSNTSAAVLRQSIAALRLNGQSRLHMVKESDRRRRLILSTLVSAGARATIYSTRGLTDGSARELCLRRVVQDALRGDEGVSRILLERDETMVGLDRRTLFAELARHAQGSRLVYAHERASYEPLLCLPDAIGWAHLRGGEWRMRARALVAAVHRL